jgi:hypothetical protein
MYFKPPFGKDTLAVETIRVITLWITNMLSAPPKIHLLSSNFESHYPQRSEPSTLKRINIMTRLALTRLSHSIE